MSYVATEYALLKVMATLAIATTYAYQQWNRGFTEWDDLVDKQFYEAEAFWEDWDDIMISEESEWVRLWPKLPQ